MGACGDDGLEVGAYRLTIPEGWSSNYRVDGPARVATLVSPGHELACELTVLSDGRSFGDDDSRAWVGDARRVFGDRGEIRTEVELGGATLQGRTLTGATPRARWDLAGSAPATVEAVAAGQGAELVGLVIGYREPRPELRQICLNAIRR
ncbi:MAG: hypothetical protein AAGF12_13850 [Myxococcota bacterium]